MTTKTDAELGRLIHERQMTLCGFRDNWEHIGEFLQGVNAAAARAVRDAVLPAESVVVDRSVAERWLDVRAERHPGSHEATDADDELFDELTAALGEGE